MPAQKRPLQPADSDDSDGHVPVGRAASSRGGGGGVSHESDGEDAARRAREPPRDQRDGDPDEGDGGGGDGSGGGSDSESSLNGAGDKDEFIIVKLAEIRKEVQCPICLGIIRKTRTVMECLHRFCRDCIDKSMRLGNNECPACRTHCASRRSLRDDPNYDALIAALYPDIDKYEEEELAFSEEERSRNKKIQATIEETIRRQSEAVGKKRSTAKATATVFARKYRRNMRTRGRGKTIAPDIAPTGSDNEDREEGNAIDTTKESSSADDRSSDLMPKRGRKRPASRASPARTIGSSDHVFEENDELIGGKESFTTSPLRGEMLAWGKNGTRSQTRHGSVGGSNGRMAKGGRVAKLVDHLRTTDDMDKEFNLYLVLLPLDEQSMPNLDKPYISCRPTLSIRHLVQFIALQLSRQVEELDIFMRIDHCNGSVTTQDCTTGVAKMRLSDGLERIREDKLLSELHPSFTSHHGDLELLYALKTQG
ncbi:putative E3 ubiquitin-protein ligase RING1a isoform X1 [Oryza sativa Japonica Group]|uniref:putative E3 ubiquitin-protein ligase RING1a isoform X1 n=1 Tax=Oryza sativa subsp. japonica TaxID=39947 RepID=UPI000E1C28CE|nr:putative E3 ubiquitin-protein ligase RING1a isoform X2 [Oryza sativa Japonica Group]KAF2952797.1 hypothetical protein DAI22_01g363200 [Oryza sativa Japonica Group]